MSCPPRSFDPALANFVLAGQLPGDLTLATGEIMTNQKHSNSKHSPDMFQIDF